MDMNPLTEVPEVKVPVDSKMANVVPMKEKNGANALSELQESFKNIGFPWFSNVCL